MNLPSDTSADLTLESIHKMNNVIIGTGGGVFLARTLMWGTLAGPNRINQLFNQSVESAVLGVRDGWDRD